MKVIFDNFKSITGWSEAHCIYKLCEWLDKNGYGMDCKSNYNMYCEEMLKEDFDKNKNDSGDWWENGKGITAHGDKNYTFRLELNDSEYLQNDFKYKVRFYIYIAK